MRINEIENVNLDEGFMDTVKNFLGKKPESTQSVSDTDSHNDSNTLVKQWFGNAHPSAKDDNSMPMVVQYYGSPDKRAGNKFNTEQILGFPGIQFAPASSKTIRANQFYVKISKPMYSKQLEGVTPITKEIASVFKQSILGKKDDRITGIYDNISKGNCSLQYIQKVAEFLLKSNLSDLYIKLSNVLRKNFDGIIYKNAKGISCYVVFSKNQIIPVSR